MSAFPGKRFTLVYFYSQDDSAPPAYHYYPNTIGQGDVVVCLRENQEPWDEFITLVFELLNSRSERRFAELYQKAKAGTISKGEFATNVLRAEFNAVRDTRDLVRGLELSKKDKSKAPYYSSFLGCPSDFESFLPYAKKTSPGRDPLRDYEAQYDALRKGITGD